MNRLKNENERFNLENQKRSQEYNKIIKSDFKLVLFYRIEAIKNEYELMIDILKNESR